MAEVEKEQLPGQSRCPNHIPADKNG